MEFGEPSPGQLDVDRRTLIRRAAVLSAATAWATPTVQSLASPAFATGSAFQCNACLTGGGKVLNATLIGFGICYVTYGIGRICCDGSTDPEIRVQAHFKGGSVGAIFKEKLTLVCSKTGNPAPPPQTAECPNQFTGTAETQYCRWGKDLSGKFRLTFDFQDFGEPGRLDKVALQVHLITDPNNPVPILVASGTTAGGNLQAHGSPHTRKCDC